MRHALLLAVRCRHSHRDDRRRCTASTGRIRRAGIPPRAFPACGKARPPTPPSCPTSRTLGHMSCRSGNAQLRIRCGLATLAPSSAACSSVAARQWSAGRGGGEWGLTLVGEGACAAEAARQAADPDQQRPLRDDPQASHLQRVVGAWPARHHPRLVHVEANLRGIIRSSFRGHDGQVNQERPGSEWRWQAPYARGTTASEPARG